jgi:glutathione S-transferase
MKIYGDMISPYVRMCIVIAYETGLAGELDLIDTDVTIANENPDLAAMSPIGQIPVLATEDSGFVHDSRVIVDYFCHRGGRQSLLDGLGGRYRILTLQAIACGIADAAVFHRNENAQRPAELHWQSLLDRQRTRVMHGLDALEDHWQAELAEVNVGSLSVAVVLSYLDFRFDAWAWRPERPRLSRFHAEFSERQSMRATSLAKA